MTARSAGLVAPPPVPGVLCRRPAAARGERMAESPSPSTSPSSCAATFSCGNPPPCPVVPSSHRQLCVPLQLPCPSWGGHRQLCKPSATTLLSRASLVPGGPRPLCEPSSTLPSSRPATISSANPSSTPPSRPTTLSCANRQPHPRLPSLVPGGHDSKASVFSCLPFTGLRVSLVEKIACPRHWL